MVSPNSPETQGAAAPINGAPGFTRDPANGIWIAPMGTVAEYISEKRK